MWRKVTRRERKPIFTNTRLCTLNKVLKVGQIVEDTILRSLLVSSIKSPYNLVTTEALGSRKFRCGPHNVYSYLAYQLYSCR